MSLNGVKTLTFDTGGTILDWHTGAAGSDESIRVFKNMPIFLVPE